MKHALAVAVATLSSLCCAAPLTLLKDINRTLSVDSTVATAAPVAGGAVLTLCADNFGCDPWFTDGTAANTWPLRRSGSSTLEGYAALGGKAYFLDVGLQSLWSTDGTVAGTARVASIPARGSGGAFASVNGLLLFQAYDGRDENLWRSDGTVDGTYVVAQTSIGVDAVASGNRMFFACSPLWASGSELCVTDGTTAGTAVVKDINPGSASANVRGLAVAAGRVFFLAYDGNANALWSSDGTAAGTVPIANAPATLSGPIIEHQGSAYFISPTQDGRYALWKSDGFTAGIVDYFGSVPSGPPPLAEIVSTGTYIFANTGTSALWRSDGTASSAIDLSGTLGAAAFRSLRAQGGDLYFTVVFTGNAAEWMLPSGSTTAQPTPMAWDAFFPGVVNGVLLAGAGQAWARDPVSGWQRLLAAPGAPSNSSQCGRGAGTLGSIFVFSADDGINGCSLWRSDGTTAGTALVKAIPIATDTSALTRYPSYTTVGPYVYFSSRSLNTLWRTDGTAAGTLEVPAVYPWQGVIAPLGNTAIVASALGAWSVPPPPAAPVQLLSMPSGMNTSTFTTAVTMGSIALVNWPIRTTSSATYTGLYRTDGTAAGTSLLLDPGTDTITNLVASDSVALFMRRPPLGNEQLWRTDGTVAGTYQLPAPPAFGIVIGPANNRFVLISQYATWVTDGTTAGTVPLLADGSTGSGNYRDGATAWSLGPPNEWTDGFAARVFNTPFGATVWGSAAARSSLFLSLEGGALTGTRLWVSGGTTDGTLPVEGAASVQGHRDNDAGPFATPAGILYFGDSNGSGWEPHLLPFDATPDPVVFPVVGDALPGHVVMSTGVPITGINVPVTITASAGARVCVSSTSACACDVQPMSTSVSANVGQYLCVAQTASSTPGGSATTTVNVAGQLATFTASTTTEKNYALKSNGGRVQAYTQYSELFPDRALNNNERAGTGLGAGDAGGTGGAWIDGTPGSFADVVDLELNGVIAVDRVVLYSLQDDLDHPVEPWDTMTFSRYGVTDFTVQAWNGLAWQTLANVTGNNLVKRTVTFTPVTTTRIRIRINGSVDGRSRLTEIEAWGGERTWSFPWAKNVALASLGSVATASSQFSGAFPVSAANDGDTIAERWTNGGGWADATADRYPDWLQVDFPQPQPISEIVVYTVQDDWANPLPPTDTMTFSQYGIVDFTVQGWDGTRWILLATVTGNTQVKRTVFLAAPFTTSRIRVNVTRALGAYSRITELEAWVVSGGGTNVALESDGASASASSRLGPYFPASAVIQGDETGSGWSQGGGWADGTPDVYPDWLQVDFARPSQIDHVTVFTVRDDWQTPSTPTDTTTFTQYGVTAFDVQAWDGSAWNTIASVTGNNLVKRTVFFNAVVTSKIRVVVNASLASYARITAVEAWTGNGTLLTNMALASAGATASASSQFGPGFGPETVMDGERKGANWSHGGGWADGTFDAYPDWAQISFPAPKSISKVVVYTLQDDWQNPVEPSDTMTFTQYGVTAFDVQGWDGTQWVTLGAVAGSNLVKQSVTFAPFATTQIRILVRNGNGVSRITEVEAWGVPAAGAPLPGVNVALASNGGVASASSQLNGSFPVSAVNDGDRKGVNWAAGGGWADATLDAYPDWVEIDFDGVKTLSQINVYTLQDDWQNPVEPTDTMGFTKYGIVDFEVQAWDGTGWQGVGRAIGNARVKRTFYLSMATSKIRVLVTNAMSLSRITEIEAIGN